MKIVFIRVCNTTEGIQASDAGWEMVLTHTHIANRPLDHLSCSDYAINWHKPLANSERHWAAANHSASRTLHMQPAQREHSWF